MNAESAIEFPEELTAEMLSGFQTTPRGCTRPRVGMIGGRKYIAKCGGWSQHSSDGHVRNERRVVAERLPQAGVRRIC